MGCIGTMSKATAAGRVRRGRATAWIPLLLLGAVAGAWHNSLQVPFLLDDGPAIVENPAIQRPGNLRELLWPAADGGVTTAGRPVLTLSLALNHALSGTEVWSYHAVNVLIHGLAGLVLFGLLRRLGMRAWPDGPGSKPGETDGRGRDRMGPGPAEGRAGLLAGPGGWAGAVTAVWLLHPLQTAAVTYVIQRAEALAGLWALLTLYGLVRAADAERRGRWLGLSVLACWAGMATKESVAALPLLALVLDRTFLAGSWREAWRLRRGYYLGLGASWGLLAVLVAGTGGRGGTAGFGTEISSWTYLLTQCEAVVHYLRLVLWPHPLVFDHGTATVAGLGDVWVQALLLVGLVGLTGWALVRRPRWGFAGVWFFALLAPSSSVVPVASQTMAEHRMYLALAAPVALVLGVLWRVAGRWSPGIAWGWAGICLVLTIGRNADYASAQAIWADTVAKRPGNARAHQNLGQAELARGRLVEAEAHLGRAIALAPGRPEPHYNLGLVLARQERWAEAVTSYERALMLEPASAPAHTNLANALLALGRPREAEQHYAEALRLRPDLPAAVASYGNFLLETGRPAEALAQAERAARLRPDEADFPYNAGLAAAMLGRFREAEAFFRRAVRLQPGHAEAHHNLGNVLLEQDRPSEAVAAFERALAARPDYFEPRRTLALLFLLHLNRPAEARAHLEVLARARPDNAEIGQALQQARRLAP